MKESSIIALAKSSYENAYEGINRVLRMTGPLKLKSNQTIIIKINFCNARTADTGTVTHPLFLDATLHYLRENYNSLKIYVVESDATVVLAERFVVWLGYQQILDKWGAKFINLSKVGISPRPIKGRYFKEVPIPDIFDECNFFITMPKPKTNPRATMTCCLKNQFGCLPNIDKNIYHSHLDDVISDLNCAIRPDLCLVDGIIAQGGSQGPSFGIPIPLNTIICSQDPVAADSYVAKLIGFSPFFVGHIRKSAASGIGSMNYRLVGDKIEKVSFETNILEMRLLQFAGSLQKKALLRFRAAGRK